MDTSTPGTTFSFLLFRTVSVALEAGNYTLWFFTLLPLSRPVKRSQIQGRACVWLAVCTACPGRTRLLCGGEWLHLQVFAVLVALLGSVFSCCWDKLPSQIIDAFQVQGSKVSCKHSCTLHLHESLFWLSRNLRRQNSVINFTPLFNGNLYIVPIQHKPGSDDVGTVLKDVQSAGKSIVLLWDEPNVKGWSFAKLGYVLGNHPSSVTNPNSGVLWVGSAWVPVLL